MHKIREIVTRNMRRIDGNKHIISFAAIVNLVLEGDGNKVDIAQVRGCT
jgi:hypothetical protein